MVPGSTLMYGSSFCIGTFSPRRSSSMPTAALVSPLPSELTPPRVTNTCLAIPCCVLASLLRDRPPNSRRSPPLHKRPVILGRVDANRGLIIDAHRDFITRGEDAKLFQVLDFLDCGPGEFVDPQ